VRHDHESDVVFEDREGATSRIVNRLEKECFVLVTAAPTGDDPAEYEQAQQTGRANESQSSA